MKFLYLLFFVVVLFSCNSNAEESAVIDSTQIDNTTITAKDIEAIKVMEYGVDVKAKTSLDSWQAYSDVSRAVAQVKNADFSFFTADEELFLSTVKELSTTIPEQIHSDPVQARILALTTKMYSLEEMLSLQTSQKKDKLSSVKDVLQAFSYLILQVNKKYEKEAQNIIKPVFNEIEIETE